MIRLDVRALKVLMTESKSKDMFKNDENPLTEEELQRKLKALLNLTTTIIRREEKFGNEAINLMKILAYLESQGISSSVIRNDHIRILSSYNLLYSNSTSCCSTIGTSEQVHRMFCDIICAENEKSLEMDILNNCLKSVVLISPNAFHSKLHIRCLMALWGRAIKYPQLVREFRHLGFFLCRQSYRVHLYAADSNDKDTMAMDLSIEQKTRELFEELFGATDEDTIRLRCFELRILCRSSEDNPTSETLLAKCREIRPSFEEYVRLNGENGLHVLKKIKSTEYEVFSFYTTDPKKYSWEEFLTESVIFYTNMYNICFRYLGQHPFTYDWLEINMECFKELPKTSETIDLLRKSRNIVLPEVPIQEDDEDLFLKQYLFLHLLAATVLDNFLSSDNSVNFESALVEELSSQCEIWHEWYIKQCAECMEVQGTSKVSEEMIREIVRILINCLDKLEKYDQILNLMKSFGIVLKKILDEFEDVKEALQKYLESHGPTLLEIHDKIFKIATTKNLSENLKKDLLKQYMIFAKCVLKSTVTAGSHIETEEESESEPVRKYHLPIHILKCCVELKSYDELVMFFEEYENIQIEHNSKGSASVAEDMIEFGAIVMDILKTMERIHSTPLIQVTLKMTEKYLSIICKEDNQSRIKGLAMSIIESCERLIDQDF